MHVYVATLGFTVYLLTELDRFICAHNPHMWALLIVTNE